MSVTIVCPQTTLFGLTGSATLWADGTYSTAAQSGMSINDRTGLAKADAYQFVSSVGIGLYSVSLLDGSGNVQWQGWVNVTATSGSFFAVLFRSEVFVDAAISSRATVAGIQSYLAGSGNRLIDIIVTDADENPLDSATVIAIQNGVQKAIRSTVSNGHLSADGTYQLAVECPGYDATVFTRTVSANATLTLPINQIAIELPTDSTTTTGYLVAKVRGTPTAGIVFTVTPSNPPVASTGFSEDSAAWTETSDGSGLVQFVGMTRKGRYKIRRGSGVEVDFTAGSGSSFELPTILGDTPNA